ALTGPAREVRQSTSAGAGAGGGQQRVEGGTGIGDHAVVGGEHASDLRGLDVDVDDLASLPVDAEVTGMAIGPPVADADDEVGLEGGGVAVADMRLDADHAGGQFVIVGDRAPAHEGGRDRDGG